MNKELTPLQAFNKIDVDTKNNYVDEFIIIQKAVKALEIIKKKQVDVSCLLFDGLEIYNENMHPSRIITQEEYDLLKEELL